MYPNWKFKIALCLTILYVIRINCDHTEEQAESDKNENLTLTFNTSANVIIDNESHPQVICEPSVLCEKLGYTRNLTFTCSANLIKLKEQNDTFSCNYTEFNPSRLKVLEIYKIICPTSETFDNCYLDALMNGLIRDNTPSINWYFALATAYSIVTIIAIVGLLRRLIVGSRARNRLTAQPV